MLEFVEVADEHARASGLLRHRPQSRQRSLYAFVDFRTVAAWAVAICWNKSIQANLADVATLRAHVARGAV